MAEQKKESSSADGKDKNSLLDEDIGKEFLSSWKSMSMADDDAMDFNFDTVPKGKKKTFDFEKLDMNFNLDGDFNNMSSFKMDMSDLDFTCPPKKLSESKDKNGESSGPKAGKQNGFDFSFDFNELDSFNIDSSLIKGDASSDSNLRKKVGTVEGSDTEGAEKPKTNNDKSVHVSNDSMAMKPPSSESQETLRVDTLVGNLGNLASRQDGSASKFSSLSNLDMSFENQTSDINKIIRTEETDEERDLPEKPKSTESIPEQVILKAPSQSVGQSDSDQDTVTEQVNVLGDNQNVNDKSTSLDSDCVDLQLEHSSLLHINKSDTTVGEAINVGSCPQGVTNDLQPEKCDKSLENIAKNDALKKTFCDTDIRENKKSTLELHLAPASSKPVVDKMTLTKDKALQGMQLNIISKPENKSSVNHPSSLAGTKGVSFSCQKNGDMNLGSITQAQESFRENGMKFGSKLASDSLPGSSKLMRDASSLPALLGSKDDAKSCSNTRESIISDDMPSAAKLAGNMQLSHQEVNKSKAILPGTGMSTKDVSILSARVNSSCLTEKTARNATQMSVNSQAKISGKESSRKSRITSIEGNKLASFKARTITPTLSTLKISRNTEANRVLATHIHQKEANSIVSSERSVEIQGPKASKDDHLTDSGINQKTLTPFLKRKTIEGPEADLTSLRSAKRLSQSTSKSRNSKESSEEVIEQVESKSNNLICYHPTSGLERPSEIQVTEIEVPDSVLMEDNSNIEKAEAYMKELDDICNVLKKLHVEAKELFVRAIVNDNKLLMLNHPIHEEEIRKVQKFATQLMLKGMQT